MQADSMEKDPDQAGLDQPRTEESTAGTQKKADHQQMLDQVIDPDSRPDPSGLGLGKEKTAKG